MRVIALCRMNGYSELEVGAIRIHYDALIDDTEKKIRKELGLEDDYTHTVRYLSAHDYQRVHQWYIDYIPKSYWCLLYAPNHASKNKVCIRNAIKWFEEAGRHEDANTLRHRYENILNPEPPKVALTPFEQRLLNDPDFFPSNITNVVQAIKRLVKKGLLEEAGFIKEKYVDYLCKNNPPPKCTLEEARAMFQALMEE